MKQTKEKQSLDKHSELDQESLRKKGARLCSLDKTLIQLTRLKTLKDKYKVIMVQQLDKETISIQAQSHKLVSILRFLQLRKSRAPIPIIKFNSSHHPIKMHSIAYKLVQRKKLEQVDNHYNFSMIHKILRSIPKGNSRGYRKKKKSGYFTGEMIVNFRREPTYLWTLLKKQKMKLERLFGRILEKLYMGQYKIQRGKKVMMMKILIFKIFKLKTCKNVLKRI